MHLHFHPISVTSLKNVIARYDCFLHLNILPNLTILLFDSLLPPKHWINLLLYRLLTINQIAFVLFHQASADVVRVQLIDLSQKIHKIVPPVFDNKKIPRSRDLPPILNQPYLVYKLKCDLCDVDYVGVTRRHQKLFVIFVTNRRPRKTTLYVQSDSICSKFLSNFYLLLLLLFYRIIFQFTICSETCGQCLGNSAWCRFIVCRIFW